MKKYFGFFLVGIILCLPFTLWAQKGHENCALCHSVHGAVGAALFSQKPNTIAINPATGKILGRVESICLGCHSTEGGLGIRPLDLKKTHPVDVVPSTKVSVPPEALDEGAQKGKLTCMGCHDPHPSNSYYRYLSFDAGTGGAKMDEFCAKCHPAQAKKPIKK